MSTDGYLKGKVDAGAEIDKLEKRQIFAESNKEKLGKVIAQANYETTVREEVRASNDERVGFSWSMRFLVPTRRRLDGENRYGNRDHQAGDRTLSITIVKDTACNPMPSTASPPACIPLDVTTCDETMSSA